jgi:hypothetical protein
MSLLVENGLGPGLLTGLLLLLLIWWRHAPADAPDRRVADEPAFVPESFALLRADLYAASITADDVHRMVQDEIARRLGAGDAAQWERAVEGLDRRDPLRAQRLRDALARMPVAEGVSPSRYPRLWAESVCAVWSALEPFTPPAPLPADSPPDRKAEEPSHG